VELSVVEQGYPALLLTGTSGPLDPDDLLRSGTAPGPPQRSAIADLQRSPPREAPALRCPPGLLPDLSGNRSAEAEEARMGRGRNR
jgi:hypothetical protein